MSALARASFVGATVVLAAVVCWDHRLVAKLADLLYHRRDLLVVSTAVLGVGLALLLTRSTDRRTASIVLAALVMIGLAFRLWTAAPPGRLHEIPPRLIGDENGYTALAQGLLQGRFFESPEITPVYPTFIAACYPIFGSYPAVLYVQAFVG